MPTVEYNLEGDQTGLEQSLSSVILELARVVDKATDAKEATRKLADEQKKAAADAKKLADAYKNKHKALQDFVVTANNAAGVAKAGTEWVKFLAEGFVDLLRSVAEAEEEMAGFFDADDRKRIHDLAEGLEAADTAGTMLQTTIATSLGPEIDSLIDAFIGAAKEAGEFFDWLEELRNSDAVQTFKSISDTLLAIATLGASSKLGSGFDEMAESGAEAKEAITDVNEEAKFWAAMDKKWAEEEKERAKEAIKDLADWKKAVQEKGKAEEKAHNDRMKAVLEGNQAEADRLDTLREKETEYQAWLADTRATAFEREIEDAEEQAEALLEVWEQQAEDYEKTQADKAKTTKKAVKDIFDAWLDLGGELADLWATETQERLDNTQTAIDDTKEKKKEAEGAEKQLLGVQLDALEQQEKAAKKAAREAFRLSQAAAVASVLSSGASAYAAMLASFAYLTVGAPFAAAGVVTPAILGQLAVIGTNKPPAHDGAVLGADEFVAGGRTMRQGEQAAVFNQRAVETGAAAEVMAVNRGASAAREVKLVLGDAGRVMGELLAREVDRPGSPLATLFGTTSNGVGDPYGAT